MKTYREEFHPKIKSDLKKIDKNVVKKVKETHLDNILTNPHSAETLKGKLSNIYSYHFRENKVDYRIAYEVLEDDTIIFYYMVAKRENFYKTIESRI
ncbi:MAG: type II toxin-antitoxin system mRNA interferase toxin, RelE/StbE family [Campylobacterota bacterium]|nr:type II toxin-antitoxin system mRNA interferase toxin, RelE/StbE family [Campylobacterota bacterium]